MSVQSVDNRNKVNKSDKAVLIGTAVAGSLAGGAYARNHISEARIKRLQDLNIDIPKYYKNFADCFDMKKAQGELKKGSITQDEFNLLKNTHDKFITAAKAEENVKKVSNTPIDKRTTTFSQAVKEANQNRSKLIKTAFQFSKNTQDKLGKLKIMNVCKANLLNREQMGKVADAYKIMAKPMVLGLAFGAFFGYLIGLGVNNLSKPKTT